MLEISREEVNVLVKLEQMLISLFFVPKLK